MGRPLAFDKEQALEQALQVFWRKGYEAASLQDLIDAMDLSKSSFYQSFSSKQDLFIKSLDHYQRRLAANLARQLEEAETAREFIEQTFADLVSTTATAAGQKGCFLMNSPNEFPFGHETLSPVITAGFGQLRKVWETAIKRAQAEGDVALKKDAAALADYLVSNIGGLRIMIKAGTPSLNLQKIVDNILLAVFAKK